MTNRRKFISSIAGGLATIPLIPLMAKSGTHSLETKPVPSTAQVLQFACIGMGSQGFSDTNALLKVSGTRFVAACDLYAGRRKHTQEIFGKDVQVYTNYQEILTRSDIDAVIVATPDHCKASICLDALKAGKHVYAEKPMIYKLDEGEKLIQAQKKYGKVFMVGSQRVSSIVYEKARNLFQTGAIGEVNYVEAWWDRFSAMGAWQYTIPPDASVETVDWKTFLHQYPEMPFSAQRFFQWRLFKEYGHGVASDLFVHLFSGLHFITGSNGPRSIYAQGGIHYWKDGRDMPDLMLGVYDYAACAAHPHFHLNLRVNFTDGSGGSSGFKFVGSEGIMQVSDNKVVLKKKKLPYDPGYRVHTFDEATQKEYIRLHQLKYPERRKEMIDPESIEYTVPEGYNDLVDHFHSFYASIVEGKTVVEDAAFGFRAAGPAVLTSLSKEKGTLIHWDPDKMKIMNP